MPERDSRPEFDPNRYVFDHYMKYQALSPRLRLLFAGTDPELTEAMKILYPRDDGIVSQTELDILDHPEPAVKLNEIIARLEQEYGIGERDIEEVLLICEKYVKTGQLDGET